MSDDSTSTRRTTARSGSSARSGNRLFLLYCRQGLTETTVKVEKQQVARAGQLPGPHRQGAGPPRPPARGPRVLRHRGLRVGRRDHRRLLRRGARPHRRRARGGGRRRRGGGRGRGRHGERHVLRIALTREQAAAFAIHATRLVEAGRPPCPLCGLPLDPVGPRLPAHERPPATGRPEPRCPTADRRARPHRGRDGGARAHRRAARTPPCS